MSSSSYSSSVLRVDVNSQVISQTFQVIVAIFLFFLQVPHIVHVVPISYATVTDSVFIILLVLEQLVSIPLVQNLSNRVVPSTDGSHHLVAVVLPFTFLVFFNPTAGSHTPGRSCARSRLTRDPLSNPGRWRTPLLSEGSA